MLRATCLFAGLLACSLFIVLPAVSATEGEQTTPAAVAGDGKTTTPTPNTTTIFDPESLRASKSDFIFPLVCGLAGIPIFAFVIAAALYQPFHTRKREEKKRYEDALEQKKRSDSATEKFKLLQQQISIQPSAKEEKLSKKQKAALAASKV